MIVRHEDLCLWHPSLLTHLGVEVGLELVVTTYTTGSVSAMTRDCLTTAPPKAIWVGEGS